MIIKLKNLLPYDWNYEEIEDKIKIWYKNKRKRSPTNLLLNKEIEISEDLGILLGFWAGDGTKDMFILCNNEILIIKEMNSLLEKIFGLINLNLRISIPPNFKKEEKNILFTTRQLFPTIKDIKSRNYYENRNSPFWHLQYTKILFIKLIKILYNYMVLNVDKSNEYWNGYLKGIIAAEGHMELRKGYNTLSRISIAQIDNKIRKSIIKSLDARKISYSTDIKYIRISGKENYNVILKNRLYDLHPKKKEDFLIGYNNIKQNQYLPTEASRLILNELKIPKRISMVAKEINRCRQTIRDHLLLKQNSLYNKGLVKKCGKTRGARGSFYGDLWTLTKKGQNYLKLMEENKNGKNIF